MSAEAAAGEPSAPDEDVGSEAGNSGIEPALETASGAPQEAGPGEEADVPSDAPPEIHGDLGPDESAAGTLPDDQEPELAAPPIPPFVDVRDLDWDAIAASLGPGAVRARIRGTVERLEALLDSEGGAGMLFDDNRTSRSDRALRLTEVSDEPLWFIGDIHGDLLALDTALALIDREAAREGATRARIVLLGDLFDDGGYGLETLLRVFELILDLSLIHI